MCRLQKMVSARDSSPLRRTIAQKTARQKPRSSPEARPISTSTIPPKTVRRLRQPLLSCQGVAANRKLRDKSLAQFSAGTDLHSLWHAIHSELAVPPAPHQSPAVLCGENNQARGCSPPVSIRKWQHNTPMGV